MDADDSTYTTPIDCGNIVDKDASTGMKTHTVKTFLNGGNSSHSIHLLRDLLYCMSLVNVPVSVLKVSQEIKIGGREYVYLKLNQKVKYIQPWWSNAKK